MARDHHDFSRDKDTPLNVVQALEAEDITLEEAAIAIPSYGSGQSRAFPNEFHSKKTPR